MLLIRHSIHPSIQTVSAQATEIQGFCPGEGPNIFQTFRCSTQTQTSCLAAIRPGRFARLRVDFKGKLLDGKTGKWQTRKARVLSSPVEVDKFIPIFTGLGIQIIVVQDFFHQQYVHLFVVNDVFLRGLIHSKLSFKMLQNLRTVFHVVLVLDNYFVAKVNILLMVQKSCIS